MMETVKSPFYIKRIMPLPKKRPLMFSRIPTLNIKERGFSYSISKGFGLAYFTNKHGYLVYRVVKPVEAQESRG